MGDHKCIYRILERKPLEKHPFRRPRRQDKIKIKLREISCGDQNWMNISGSCTVVDHFEQCNKPLGSIKCRQFLDFLQDCAPWK
jgi:hypothetical protein